MNQGIQPRPRIDRAEGDTPDTEAVEPEQRATLDDDLDLQKDLLERIRTHSEKNKANRMADVQQARDQRLYFRGIQHFYWSARDNDVIFGSDDAENDPYDRTFNVYQGYGKIFQSTFMGAKPKVRAEADNPLDDASVRITAKANTYERIYRKNNDIGDMQLEMSRLMWTDGRIVTLTTRNEVGDEVTKLFGVLESRVPFAAKNRSECTMIQTEDEFPLAILKKKYGDEPDKRKAINSGNGDSYERNARMSVKRQAGSDTTISPMSGEDSYGMGTETHSYLRPEFFEDFEEAKREQFLEIFPEGCCIVHSGDVYLASYEFDCDNLDVLHALPGDGMSRPSIGASMMPLQDSINTGMNLTEEMFDHGIPTTYYDEKTNIDGLNKQREMPGQSRKMTKGQNEPASNHFFQTEMVNPPAQLMQYMELLRGPLAQFATGQQPALFGGDMQDQKTASGYAQARSMALGQMAIVWKPFTSWYSREVTRAVKLASMRDQEITSTLPPASPGGKPESVTVNPGELQGAKFTNESDENFPETFSEIGNKLMNILQVAGPLADKLLEQPANLYLLKQYWGIQDLIVPGEDIFEGVLSDIARMKDMPLTPDPNQPAPQMLPMPGQPPPVVQYVSPVQINADYLSPEDLAFGYEEVKRWVNGTEGREAKWAEPNWYKNVNLYGMQYKQAMQPPPPAPEPPPGLTINYDSLPASGKIQAAQQRKIVLTSADIATVPPKTTGAGQ